MIYKWIEKTICKIPFIDELCYLYRNTRQPDATIFDDEIYQLEYTLKFLEKNYHLTNHELFKELLGMPWISHIHTTNTKLGYRFDILLTTLFPYDNKTKTMHAFAIRNKTGKIKTFMNSKDKYDQISLPLV